MGLVFSERALETEVVGAAKTLKPTDTGKTFILDAAGGATLTLPSLDYGLNFRFVVGSAFATTNWVVDSAEGDNINGSLIVAGAAVQASGEDQVNFVPQGWNIGDFVELIADKDNDQWLVSGVGFASGGITVTDPS